MQAMNLSLTKHPSASLKESFQSSKVKIDGSVQDKVAKEMKRKNDSLNYLLKKLKRRVEPFVSPYLMIKLQVRV